MVGDDGGRPAPSRLIVLVVLPLVVNAVLRAIGATASKFAGRLG